MGFSIWCSTEMMCLPFLVLDIVDGVGRLYLKGDGLSSEVLKGDLHGGRVKTTCPKFVSRDRGVDVKKETVAPKR